MYKMCKTAQSAARQHEIEQALLTCMRGKRYEEITVRELCDSIQLPRKAFYRYFESKDGALHALLDHTLADFGHFGTEYYATGRRSLRGDLAQFFLFWHTHRALLDALERNNLTGLLLDTAVHFPLRDMISPEKFLPEETAWMRTQVFRFAICGLMIQMLEWYRADFRESAEEMAQAACRMLSRPLFPELARLGITD